ncbi:MULTISPECIES: PTS system mannose/fructose/N-acetylgalactosamine-transporter subunit IIB [Dellaglioa]|uniref:PTS sugar transporter subunit IIB n=1 Tax=Dellaglioa carnosa TaxID=2995136 RepID=A0ABT4JLU1_9LACO|nr:MULTISPECIES: PTS sugar transporter subunit IIB [Dellaglioa]MCZ2491337.1 PTS sugar transporter subunit IIB [Dellaglioa carnosa]MCZ2494415.1 PTS sugar transporter subunit IIB [Dellaglioa carnosa]MDK1717759.1 PTS sugar transporter subunit IIB [Dellaglioa algida]MDK1729337.1 PTS sugar transporter subunit IIB [Dellaglioa algida]MDK1731169.1 PTS sugar transporter subunit IIB [Dellaglioa carnosa]
MEGIKHIRIDDRLIHGQVATMWTNKLGVSRIMVINDEVSKNDIQKSVLRMAAPSNVSTSLISKDTAFKNIQSGKYKGQSVLIIVKSPLDLLELSNRGMDIGAINVGNMSAKDNTRVIRPSISVTPEEEEALIELINRKIEVTAIMTPDDSKILLKDYL